jgi:oligoribonuclease NrnB/cAMP/cGMP phosphodiesterase (DHH superfamily)
MGTFPWRDDRRFHVITRGNVDGIVSAAFLLARIPDIKVSFVTSSTTALDVLRRDIQSRSFFIVDLGLDDRLLKNINDKAKQGAEVHLLDHHQQSEAAGLELEPGVNVVAKQGMSAASVVYDYLDLNGEYTHLAAIADVVEYCRSRMLDETAKRHGYERLEEEARMLDFSWRFMVDDDRFRIQAARRLAGGCWPSEVPEVSRRYLQVLNEGRWERALEKVRKRMVVRDGLGLLKFGRYRTSLFGFGTRALSKVAEDAGCRVAMLLNSRKSRTSVSLRGLGPEYLRPDPPFNLGRFVHEFTQEYGVTGGGHPSSAGAKIHTRDAPTLLQQVYCLA